MATNAAVHVALLVACKPTVPKLRFLGGRWSEAIFTTLNKDDIGTDALSQSQNLPNTKSQNLSNAKSRNLQNAKSQNHLIIIDCFWKWKYLFSKLYILTPLAPTSANISEWLSALLHCQWRRKSKSSKSKKKGGETKYQQWRVFFDRWEIRNFSIFPLQYFHNQFWSRLLPDHC